MQNNPEKKKKRDPLKNEYGIVRLVRRIVHLVKRIISTNTQWDQMTRQQFCKKFAVSKEQVKYE